MADVAALYTVNENALVRHLASHALILAVTSAAKKKPSAASAAAVAVKPGKRVLRRPPQPKASPTNVVTYPLSVLRDLLDEDDDPPLVPSRSGSEPVVTARASLDEILASIRQVMKDVRSANVPFGDKATALRVALQAVRLLAGLTGELGATESTVASSPYFRRMLHVILEAVRGPAFAEARQAILDALEREERGNGRQNQAAE